MVGVAAPGAVGHAAVAVYRGNDLGIAQIVGRLAGPASSFAEQLTYQALAMFVEIVGNGAPLVLLHGWAMHGGIFAPLVELLKHHHRLYIVDLPGHGRSRDLVFDLPENIAQLAGVLPRAAYLGWSLGGAFVTRLALDYPQRVSHLICLASSPRFVLGEAWPHAVASDTFARFARDLQADWQAVVQRFLALEVFGSDAQKSELRWLREQVYKHGDPDLQALLYGLQLLGEIDLRAELTDLHCPSLWLGGSRDRLVPPEALAAAAQLSGGQSAIIGGAGHAPFLTQAEQVATHLLKFFTDYEVL